jgi:hypothetical protein
MESKSLQTKLVEFSRIHRDVLDSLRVLYDQNIRYGLYAGSYVSLVSANRISPDIDLLVADEDFGKILSIFPQVIHKKKSYGEFIYLDESELVEMMAHAFVQVANSKYPFRLTDLAFKNSDDYVVDDVHIRLLNPADTILLKSMLQRGESEGKHDIEDIEALSKYASIDKQYLMQRIEESNANEPRVTELLKSLNII